MWTKVDRVYSINLGLNMSTKYVAGALFAMTMIMVSIALVMAVIVTNIFLRKDGKKRVPRFLKMIFLRQLCTSCPAGRGMLPVTVTVTSSLDNHVTLSSPATGGTTIDRVLTVPDIEMDSLSVLSELDIVSPPKCHNCRPSQLTSLSAPTRRLSNNTIGNGRRRHSSIYSPEESTCPQKSQHELDCETEWRHLAKVVDRICFWIFLASSVGLLGALFGTIPSYNIIAQW